MSAAPASSATTGAGAAESEPARAPGSWRPWLGWRCPAEAQRRRHQCSRPAPRRPENPAIVARSPRPRPPRWARPPRSPGRRRRSTAGQPADIQSYGSKARRILKRTFAHRVNGRSRPRRPDRVADARSQPGLGPATRLNQARVRRTWLSEAGAGQAARGPLRGSRRARRPLPSTTRMSFAAPIAVGRMLRR